MPRTAVLPIVTLLLGAAAPLAAAPAPLTKPNVLVILADDLGYADLGCQGSKEVLSPQIDSIAAAGVRCTAGYVSAPQCSPSRAGLITGRYQNRFGFEANWPAIFGGTAGLPPSETTIADRLAAVGYTTGVIGKWHLGHNAAMRPSARGFQESLWHPNGGVLLPNPAKGTIAYFRGNEPVELPGYSTDVFGQEASQFITRHGDRPWFLYLAFVPPHWPMEAKPQHMQQFAHVRDLHRRTMLAMMASLDENVGRVLATLRQTGQEERTLIFFLSDNGGATGGPRPDPDGEFIYGINTSLNTPCRGQKGDLLEGGIRIPFLVQWKGRIPAGKTCDQPVISLDILPTALAAAGVAVDPAWKLDGADLLPLLTGQSDRPVHETLYWRFRFPPRQLALHRWAIRQGDWKLVKNNQEPLALYNLAADMGEAHDQAAAQPERVRAMEAAWRQWNEQLQEPAWVDPPPVVRGTRDARAVDGLTEFQLHCTGPDPQAIFGPIPPAPGPFTLELKYRSTCAGPGEIFWSTRPGGKFTSEQRVGFKPIHDDQWHDDVVRLPVSEAITFLRFDPGNAPGLIRVARFVLKDGAGSVVKAWMGKPAPAAKKPAAPQ